MTWVVAVVVAAQSPAVIDLVSSTDARVLTRLHNELEALGYRVVHRRPDEPRTLGARGEVVWSRGQLLARAGFDGTPREATFDDPNDDAVWAIRVTEWLRSDASALHAPSPVVIPVVEPSRWAFDIGARGVARWNPGIGVGGGFSLSIAAWSVEFFGIELSLPGLTWTSVGRGDVAALVRELSFAVRALFQFPLSQAFRLLVGAGVGGRHVFAEGLAPVTSGVGVLVGEGSLVAALRWHASELVFLEWRNDVSVSVPSVALQFGGVPVGTLGVPGLQTSLGGGIRW